MRALSRTVYPAQGPAEAGHYVRMKSILSLWIFDWRKLLAYSHRWLGIAGCVLFVAWFVSGIVMMYARMPGMANEERLARAAVLDLSAVRLSPADAAEKASVRAD